MSFSRSFFLHQKIKINTSHQKLKLYNLLKIFSINVYFDILFVNEKTDILEFKI
jgi:hypothetical protein